MNSFDFKDRVVFVAGGTSGINLGIAHAFARHGAHIAVISRSPEKVGAAKTELKKHGTKVFGAAADVRDVAAVSAALTDAHAALGNFDVLISGAAGNFPAAALGMSTNAFKAVVDIDLLGTFNVLRTGHQYLRKPGAAVINISAPQAMHAQPLQAHVCAAKAGVDMLTQVLAIEWGADGVRVNSVIPGPIADTEGMARLAPTEETKEFARRAVPLGRFGTKEEVANACLFLSSPLAAYITGAILPVDGGVTAAGPRGFNQALAQQLARA
jgi:NAD(P)-dependent dehydrogenase (short-subunit alcohol dehydrogenase family)